VAVEALWAGDASAADASQAAYFRGVLIEERMRVCDDLVRSRARLQEYVDGAHVVGLRAMARIRSHVRELEAKQREVDRLIAALDRRFAAVWSGEGQ